MSTQTFQQKESQLGKIPALAEKAVNKGHEVSLKVKLKVKPGRRYYGEKKDER